MKNRNIVLEIFVFLFSVLILFYCIISSPFTKIDCDKSQDYCFVQCALSPEHKNGLQFTTKYQYDISNISNVDYVLKKVTHPRAQEFLSKFYIININQKQELGGVIPHGYGEINYDSFSIGNNKDFVSKFNKYLNINNNENKFVLYHVSLELKIFILFFIFTLILLSKNSNTKELPIGLNILISEVIALSLKALLFILISNFI